MRPLISVSHGDPGAVAPCPAVGVPAAPPPSHSPVCFHGGGMLRFYFILPLFNLATAFLRCSHQVAWAN